MKTSGKQRNLPLQSHRGAVTMDASISGCQNYRYWLSRLWGGDEKNVMIFVMLNPSTADAYEDDPTIRRCTSFAKREGYDGLIVINLFAYRATDPKDLKTAKQPISIHNPLAYYVTVFAKHYKLPVVCAWGTHGEYLNQDRDFIRMCLEENMPMLCLGTTKHGHPKHPLYLASNTVLVPFKDKEFQND